ncbi:MAG: RHS repeat protein [Chitinophagaceae bacterium]|nr:RHS repeat protein [Chitinophagaceae bacterium]
MPVSLFSGTPQISISISDFNYGDINFKISLDYNAGGIRVDDIATNVGLGWSLMAGGVITRSIRGLPDGANEANYPGPNFNPAINPFHELEFGSTPDYELAKDLVNNNRDMERDIYYYNFLGNSGKFVIDRNGIPRLVPANPNFKITPYNGSFYNGFIITDDKGYKYYFTEHEGSGSGISVCTLGQESSRENNSGNNSACYLSKIVSPNNRQVFLEYDSYTYTVESNYSEVQYERQYPISSGCDDLSASNRKCKKVYPLYGLRVKKIISDDNSTKIDFLYSIVKRLDLKHNGQDAGNYLEGIKTYFNNIQRKSWTLSYGYFNQNYAPRLKLLAVKEYNLPPYQFTYNETHSLPERLSLSQDHWGYYNGKINNTFIPPVPLASKMTGADRSPDFDYMQSGSLIKMAYPTGGYTEFEYEPHKDLVTESTTTYQQGNAYVEAAANSGDSYTYADFILPAGAVGVNWSWSLSLENYDDFTAGSIIDGNDPSIVYRYINGPAYGYATLNDLTVDHNYKLRLYRSNLVDYGGLAVNWQTPVTTTVTQERIMYGGLRIKAIKNFDFQNHIATSKYYDYNWSETSANSSLILPPDANKVYFNLFESLNSNTGNPIPCGNWEFSSFSVPILGVALEPGIGYEQVIEKNILNGSTGRTIYKYSTGCSGIGISINSNSNTELGKGLLLEKTDQLFNSITSTYENIAKTKNTYQSVYDSQCEENGNFCLPNESITPHLKISRILPERVTQVWNQLFTYPAKWSVEKYYTVAVPFYLQQTENTTYSPGSNNQINTITNYFYSNPLHLYPTRTERTNSKGELIKTINRGPFEKNDINAVTPLTGAELAAIDEMVNRNIVSPVLQTEQYNNTTLLNRTLITYRNWGGTILKPEKAKYQNEANPIETKYLYNKYDDKGNLHERQKENDFIETYLWGYSQEYPVVKIIGKSYADVVSLAGVNQALLNSPPDDATFRANLAIYRTNLSGAQVYTYTYKPLVGITSETDPNGKTTYYEYDVLNRLSIIRDNDNNIVKKICYNYAGQPENCITCNDVSPDWQNTANVRCLTGTCGRTGFQEQEQRDMNACSPTYNLTQWISAGYNETTCPPETCVALTSYNNMGDQDLIATYYNTSTQVVYTFNVPIAGGQQPLGSIPVGTYNLSISRLYSNIDGTFQSGCGNQTITGSTPVSFYNINVSSTSCNFISIDF